MTNLTRERLKIYVPGEAASLLDKLGEFFRNRNIDCYVVGGFVRDGLISRSNNDIDLAVDGDAIAIASEVAEALDAKMVPLDDVNQVARVIFPQTDYQWHLDFATTRGSIEQDLSLRDFTINSVAIRLSGVKTDWSQVEVIDPLNGCRDLSQKIVRAVSDESFREDAARLLRAVRLAATLDFSIEPATEALIRRDSALLHTVAGERVRDELCQILETHTAYKSLRYLDRLSLLASLMPELTGTKGVTQPKEHFWDVFDHSLETVACIEILLREQFSNSQAELIALVPWSPEIAQHFGQESTGGRTRRAFLKLAALLHDIGKPMTKTIEQSGRMRFLGHAKEGSAMAVQIMDRLRLSNREIKMVQLMIENHLRPGFMLSEDLPTRRAIYKYFRDTGDVGIDTLFLGLADHLAARGPMLDPDQWRKHVEVTQYILSKWFEEKATIVPPKLIDGHILMEKLGLSPGPQIGQLLESVREAQAAGEIQTAEEAIDFVERQLGRNR